MINGNSPEADKNQNQQQQKTQEKYKERFLSFLCLAFTLKLPLQLFGLTEKKYHRTCFLLSLSSHSTQQSVSCTVCSMRGPACRPIAFH